MEQFEKTIVTKYEYIVIYKYSIRLKVDKRHTKILVRRINQGGTKQEQGRRAKVLQIITRSRYTHNLTYSHDPDDGEQECIVSTRWWTNDVLPTERKFYIKNTNTAC